MYAYNLHNWDVQERKVYGYFGGRGEGLEIPD